MNWKLRPNLHRAVLKSNLPCRNPNRLFSKTTYVFYSWMFFLHHLDPTFSQRKTRRSDHENLQFQVFFSNKKRLPNLRRVSNSCPKKLSQTIVRPNTPGLMMFKIWNPKVRGPCCVRFLFSEKDGRSGEVHNSIYTPEIWRIDPNNGIVWSRSSFFLGVFLMIVLWLKKIDVLLIVAGEEIICWDLLKPNCKKGDSHSPVLNRCIISTNQKVSRFFPQKPGPNSSLVSGWMFNGMLVGDAWNFLETIFGAKCLIVEIYIEKKQPCINMNSLNSYQCLSSVKKISNHWNRKTLIATQSHNAIWEQEMEER